MKFRRHDSCPNAHASRAGGRAAHVRSFWQQNTGHWARAAGPIIQHGLDKDIVTAKFHEIGLI